MRNHPLFLAIMHGVKLGRSPWQRQQLWRWWETTIVVVVVVVVAEMERE
jgi:hypothetical protein